MYTAAATFDDHPTSIYNHKFSYRATLHSTTRLHLSLLMVEPHELDSTIKWQEVRATFTWLTPDLRRSGKRRGCKCWSRPVHCGMFSSLLSSRFQSLNNHRIPMKKLCIFTKSRLPSPVYEILSHKKKKLQYITCDENSHQGDFTLHELAISLI